jgi:hypothetical protein
VKSFGTMPAGARPNKTTGEATATSRERCVNQPLSDREDSLRLCGDSAKTPENFAKTPESFAKTPESFAKANGDAPSSRVRVIRQIFAEAKDCCQNCGSTYALEIDHIRPRAMGGGPERENLRVLCRNCNQRAAVKMFGAQARGRAR